MLADHPPHTCARPEVSWLGGRRLICPRLSQPTQRIIIQLPSINLPSLPTHLYTTQAPCLHHYANDKHDDDHGRLGCCYSFCRCFKWRLRRGGHHVRRFVRRPSACHQGAWPPSSQYCASRVAVYPSPSPQLLHKGKDHHASCRP